ncbi:GtrA-like protein [Ruminiclostridium hungatei]|uniref:GtrA-like protein n=1 Tax=Ruminiclostridium hungatei TaxID=48256 RepID=A0A1V4SQA4_RUMHU|nr:GtrA family protein [Ruminiclostridium hungatei]OPX45427.1 GtrA-like protein [Ruminiclostridium hungatei]
MGKYTDLIKKLLNTSIIKYGMVGIINTLITGIIMFALMNIFSVSLRISNVVGYIAGFINSFILNKLWTFKGVKSSTLTQFLRFTGVFAVCFLLQHGLVLVLAEKLLIDKNIAAIAGMIFYTGISYVFNKLFTFKK